MLEECHVSVRNTTTSTLTFASCIILSSSFQFIFTLEITGIMSFLMSPLFDPLFLENLCSQRTQQVQSKATCRNQVLHCLEPARDLSDFNCTDVLMCYTLFCIVLSVFADVFADLKKEAPLNGANIHSISACFRLPGRCTLGAKMSMQGVQKKPLLLSESLGDL